MKGTLEVVAAVIIRDEEVFAARRAVGRVSAGLWEFPGGKVEAGELPEDSLRRELLEELSIEVGSLSLLHREITTVGDFDIDLACYLTRLASPPPRRSSDHDLLTWQPLARLSELQWAPPDLPTVQILTRERST